MGGFLVIGSGGLLGGLFMRRLAGRVSGVDLPDFDLAAGRGAIDALVSRSGAETVLNCAAITDVDYCETHREKAFRLHDSAVEDLSLVCPRLVTFSTDHVFTGPGERPFLEDDPVSPANVYAESKLAGEEAALGSGRALVIRTSWLFAGDAGLVPRIRSRIASGGGIRAVADQVACVTYAPDLVEAAIAMISDGFTGLVHAANPGPTTPLGIARELGGGDSIEPVTWADLGLPAKRPSYSALGTSTGYVLPDRADAIERWRRGSERDR